MATVDHVSGKERPLGRTPLSAPPSMRPPPPSLPALLLAPPLLPLLPLPPPLPLLPAASLPLLDLLPLLLALVPPPAPLLAPLPAAPDGFSPLDEEEPQATASRLTVTTPVRKPIISPSYALRSEAHRHHVPNIDRMKRPTPIAASQVSPLANSRAP